MCDEKAHLHAATTAVSRALFLNESLGSSADVTRRCVGRGRLCRSRIGKRTDKHRKKNAVAYADTNHQPTGVQPGVWSAGCRCSSRQILLTKRDLPPPFNDRRRLLSSNPLFPRERAGTLVLFRPWDLGGVVPAVFTLIFFNWVGGGRKRHTRGSRLGVA